tara:strand:- start:25 stop:663 length:639 start_codon:yes stop_codon:yes gene_type:complete
MSLQLTTNEATVITQFVYGLDPRGRASAFEVKDENTIIHKLSIAHLAPYFGDSEMSMELSGLAADLLGYYPAEAEEGAWDELDDVVQEWCGDNAQEVFTLIYEEYVEHGGTLTNDFMLNDTELFYDCDDYNSVVKNNPALLKSFREVVNDYKEGAERRATAVNKAAEAAQAAARMASLYAAQAEVVSTEGVRDPLKEAQEHNARIKETLGLV